MLGKLLFSVLLVAVASKKVFFFPCGSTSHTRYHTNVARELTNMGHKVWVAIPEYLLKSGRINTNGINVLRFGANLGDLEQRVLDSHRVHERFWEGGFAHTGIHYLVTGLEIRYILREILSDESFVNAVGKLKPDLFVLDSVLFLKNMLVLPYKFDIPFAMMGTVHDVAGARVPFSPAALPMQSSDFGDTMTFFQRLETAVGYMLLLLHDPFSDSNIVAEFAPERPFITIDELGAKGEVYLAEIDPVMDYPRPMLPNTKLIGGTAISPAKPLVEPYKSFADSCEESGLAVVSFGSTMVNIPIDIFEKMVKAFEQTKLKVAWRVNYTSPNADKILTSNWLPQNDMMGHNNTKIFLSHCGKNGQYEALYHAVPIICLPIFGDQYYNSERIQQKGFGLRSDIRTITSEELAAMINKVAFGGPYKAAISKGSRLFRELYNLPKERAAFWLDHVMRYGGGYMRSAGQKMPLYQFLMLDVIAFLAAMLVILIICIVILVKHIYKNCVSRSSKLKDE